MASTTTAARIIKIIDTLRSSGLDDLADDLRPAAGADMDDRTRAEFALPILRSAGMSPTEAGRALGVVVGTDFLIAEELDADIIQIDPVRVTPRKAGRPRRKAVDSWSARLADHLGIEERHLWKMLREALEFNISAFSRLLGVERKKIYMWERGESYPNEADHRILLAALKPGIGLLGYDLEVEAPAS